MPLMTSMPDRDGSGKRVSEEQSSPHGTSTRCEEATGILEGLVEDAVGT